MNTNGTELNPSTVTKFVGDIFFVAKNGVTLKVNGDTFKVVSETWSIDTTNDRSSGGPEFDLPLGSRWVRLPHKVFGAPVWEKLS